MGRLGHQPQGEGLRPDGRPAREQLGVAVANWERATALVARFLEAKA